MGFLQLLLRFSKFPPTRLKFARRLHCDKSVVATNLSEARSRTESQICLTVHRHRKPELEIFVEHFSSQRNSLTEHLDGHEAEGLAVHQEAVAVDGRKSVDVGHVPDPCLNVLSQPGSGIWKLKRRKLYWMIWNTKCCSTNTFFTLKTKQSDSAWHVQLLTQCNAVWKLFNER